MKMFSLVLASLFLFSSVSFAMASNPWSNANNRELNNCEDVIGNRGHYRPATAQEELESQAWQKCSVNASHIANLETRVNPNNTNAVAWYNALILPVSWFNPADFADWRDLKDQYAQHVQNVYAGNY